jgi:hypothetical protein
MKLKITKFNWSEHLELKISMTLRITETVDCTSDLGCPFVSHPVQYVTACAHMNTESSSFASITV